MPASTRPDASDTELYRLYDRLDRLEELLEDLAELGVRSADEIEATVIALNEQIDALEAADGA